MGWRNRYGNRVILPIYLSGMITGQFTGELFTKERWNSKWLDYLTENNPDYLESFFVEKMDNGEILNSLNLDNVAQAFSINSSFSFNLSSLLFY